MSERPGNEPRMIAVLREYLDDVSDKELYNIATNVLAEQIKGLKLQIGMTISNARLYLNMDNLKSSNEALGNARTLKSQYRFLKSEWEKVRPADAEDPDKDDATEEQEPTSLTEVQMQALLDGEKTPV